MEERGRDFICLIDTFFFAAHAGGCRVFFFERDAGSLREHPRGFGEREILVTLHEFDNVARFAATETFEETAIGMHVERRRFLTVKRAESHEIVSALLQLHVRADERTDIGFREYFADGSLV